VRLTRERDVLDLPEILNWRRFNNCISLSGQPTEAQLSQIKELGVTHIINLGPHTNKGALPDEAGTVAKLGMSYVYIPVDFENPTTADFVVFCKAIENTEGKPVHVHCIYNARVSAFFYRFAQSGKGGSVEDTFALMDSIWRPGGVWAKFIGNLADVEKPNRYAGDDY
jgi:uncharacterized protein (TIGR01244 family)